MQRLKALGFGHQQCATALSIADGRFDVALDLLLAEPVAPPPAPVTATAATAPAPTSNTRPTAEPATRRNGSKVKTPSVIGERRRRRRGRRASAKKASAAPSRRVAPREAPASGKRGPRRRTRLSQLAPRQQRRACRLRRSLSPAMFAAWSQVPARQPAQGAVREERGEQSRVLREARAAPSAAEGGGAASVAREEKEGCEEAAVR